MADELQPLEAPITAGPTTATAATTTTATTTTAPPSLENSGPPLAPKRQRRPSVRLGEIGDQPAATVSYESHVRRAKHPWRPARESSASKAVKARSLTNLVNGGDSHSQEIAEADERNQNGDGLNSELGSRRVKGKRGSGSGIRRVRSNWVSNSKVGEGEGEDEGYSGEEGFRDLDPESDSPMKESSPDNVELDMWNRQGRNDAVELDNMSCSGVRSWLIELGLSRYTPVFEIHEVDEEVLPMLTLEDLKDMGINAVGSRRKLYTAIQKLRKGFS